MTMARNLQLPLQEGAVGRATHGRMLGFYVPTKRKRDAKELLAALREARNNPASVRRRFGDQRETVQDLPQMHHLSGDELRESEPDDVRGPVAVSDDA
jgi:hypothetical protein